MTALEASPAAKDAARTAVQTARGTLNTLAGGMSNFVSFNSMLLEAYAEASQAYVKQMSVLGEELAAFTNRRLKEQTEARESLAKCKDWSDALKTQQELFQGTSKEYLDEAARLFKIIGQATFAGVGPFMERMESLPQQLVTPKTGVSPLSPSSTPSAAPKAA